jgi:hypothetical protein
LRRRRRTGLATRRRWRRDLGGCSGGTRSRANEGLRSRSALSAGWIRTTVWKKISRLVDAMAEQIKTRRHPHCGDGSEQCMAGTAYHRHGRCTPRALLAWARAGAGKLAGGPRRPNWCYVRLGIIWAGPVTNAKTFPKYFSN